MNDVEREAVFCIADISGYTKFIFANEKEISHSQMVIRELITTLLDEINLPLKLVRIECDAIFLYAIRDYDRLWEEVSNELVTNMKALFQVFTNKVCELTIHKFCNCTACINIEELKLKIVVHSGRAAFYEVNGHQELTGISPIVIHRLMKNSVESNEYMMFTESAYSDLGVTDVSVEQGEESYDDIGVIKTYIHYPPEPEPYVPSPDAQIPEIFVEALRAEVSKEYGEVAPNPDHGFHFHTGRALATRLDYKDEWLSDLSEEAIESFAGLGNHFNLGPLHDQQKIVDAGCGAGLDCLIAAKMVGEVGEVVGVDMTTDMIDKATRNAEANGVKNVTFKLGVLENLPVEDGWADMVISNGAINLAPDKDGVFRELIRVLKPGGTAQIADILVDKPIPESAKRNIELWTG